MNRLVPLLLLAMIFSPFAEAKDYVPRYGADAAPDLVAPEGTHRRINLYQKRLLEGYLSRSSTASVDTLRMIVIPVQFADSLMGGQPGSHRPEVRDSLFFANELKHLRDYYLGASRGRFHIVWRLLGDIVDLPNGMAYYGGDEEEETRVVEMVQTIIDSVDRRVDFSRYNTVFVVHAGAGQETDTFGDSRIQLWSSFYDLEDIENAFPDSAVAGLATDDSLGADPFFVDNFIVAPANAGQDVTSVGTLGIWAYGVGSRIGLVPLSDSTPGGFPDSRGVGNFCLMSWGLYTALGFVPSFPSVFNRVLAGWVDPLEVESSGFYRLRDINSPSPPDTACLKIPINGSEYFLVVNRVHDTNFDSLFTFVNLDSTCLTPDNADSLGGAEFDFFLTDLTNPFIVKSDPRCPQGPRRYVVTGSGVYIWHVDERVIVDNLAAGFLPNDFVSRKGVDLEEADGIQDLDGTAGAISLGGFFDSFRKGHNDSFAPDTDPSSASNLGADTGIIVDGISEPGTYMMLRVLFTGPYAGKAARWEGASFGQPPTVVDIDDGGENEIVLLSDPGRIYVLTMEGREFYDRDGDPSTVEPYISAGDSVLWAGAPAVGDVDGIPGPEIVAADRSGGIRAWRSDGSELFDGDGDPGTNGILLGGAGAVCEPMLVDVDGDGDLEISVVSRTGDSLLVYFVNDSGRTVRPSDPSFAGGWPGRIGAQIAAPPSYGACGAERERSEGLVLAWVDTVGMRFGLSYLPVLALSSPGRAAMPAGEDPARLFRTPGAPAGGWDIVFDLPGGMDRAIVLPPAVGDMDGDGVDEVAFTAPTGRLLFYDPSSMPGEVHWSEELRGVLPSAPSLGDVDGNGTMEAALWDSDYFYLFNGNGTLVRGWPVRRRPVDSGEAPPLRMGDALPAPLVGDIYGDTDVEVLFASPDGALYGLERDGRAAVGFPRPVASGISRTPAIAADSGGLHLVSAGSYSVLDHYDAVLDTQLTDCGTELFIQGISGSSTGGVLYWNSYGNGSRRQRRAFPVESLRTETELAEENSFILYPNPVTGRTLNVRIEVNRPADVGIIVYNLEGEKILERYYEGVNRQSLPDYVFDERLEVGELSSGLYFTRLEVKGSGGTLLLVKPFAIKR